MATRAIERDEDLALFHEMQRREHERRSTTMRPVSDNMATEVHSARFASSSLFKIATSGGTVNLFRARTAGEELLASDMGKNDYDWLLTPPGTPLVTGSENDPMTDMAFLCAQKSLPNLVRSLTAIKTTRLSRESLAKSDPVLRASRSITTNVPNRRSSLAPANSIPSSRPVSRPSTPTSRPSIPSSTATSSNRSMANGLSSTRSAASSRSTTPVRRPSTPVLSHTQSQPMVTVGGRSSSASRVSSMPSRNTPTSRGSSPTTRTRAWQPSTMPGFSLEPPPNLRTSVPTRSVSNSRGASISSSSRQTTATVQTVSRSGISASSSSMPSTNFHKPGTLSSPSRPARPGTSLLSTGTSRPASSSSSSSSVIPSLTSHASTSSPSSTTSSRTADALPDRSRRQSCSPSVTRGRVSTADRSISRSSRGDSSPGSSIGRGSKMVDRMIQSRRAAALSLSPEKVPASQVRRAVKPMTPMAKDTTGYGKAMSRKSIDMAVRHMDMRQSASNGLRPLVSNIPSMSFYTVRSVLGRGVRPGHSPLTTSSTASSDHSMSIVRDLDQGSELEDVSSEIGSRASPRSVPDCILSVAKEERVSKWVDSGDFSRESSVELMQKFRKGMEKVGGLDSPSVCCQHLHGGGGGGGGACELCNLKSRLQSLKASPMSAESMNLSSCVPSPASSLV